MKNFRIRKGDKVMIIAGKDNGKDWQGAEASSEA